MRHRLQVLSCLALFGLSMAFPQPLRIVIRVDDIQSRNTTYIPRSIQPFEQAVTSRGGKVTWVTIPHRLIENQNADGILAHELRTSLVAGNEIAQHGYNHICTLCGNTGHEMWCATQNRGFSYTQQLNFVNSGKQILFDSIRVVPWSFVSPGHFEDTTTYAVLSASGFNSISTTRAPTGQVTPALYNLPPGSDYTWQLTAATYRAKFSQALADIHSAAASSGNYVVLFHDPFIRQGYLNGIVIQWTGELLDSLYAAYGERLHILTLTQAIDQIRGGLPIQLASLTAQVGGNGFVTLRWRTLMEVNNLGFQVQKRPAAGLWWTDIPNSFIPGHGTTSEPHDYLYVDSTAIAGSWEYRLKQIDLNGTLHFSDPIQVEITTGVRAEALAQFALHQNFPNPFNPTTTISFSLKEQTFVSLLVFDLMGREVATIASETMEAGNHTRQWDASDFPSGLYFYRLRAGRFLETRKLILLK